MRKSLKTIRFEEKNLVLYFNKFFNNFKKVYNFEDLNFSYRKESGARGVKSQEFIIWQKKDERIISLGGFIDGWNEEKIDLIIQELKKRKIKITE